MFFLTQIVQIYADFYFTLQNGLMQNVIPKEATTEESAAINNKILHSAARRSE